MRIHHPTRLMFEARRSLGHRCMNRAASEATINFEVGVGRKQQWPRQNFSESDQTSVSDTHGHIGVFIEEIQHGDESITFQSLDFQSSSSKSQTQSRASIGSQKMIRLRECRFAGDPWWRIELGLINRPCVILVVSSPQSDEKRGVNNDPEALHTRWFSGSVSCELSCLRGHPRRFPQGRRSSQTQKESLPRSSRHPQPVACGRFRIW